jgi:N utilization substance protein B
MATSIRRLARVLALQTLFEVDSVAHDPLPVLQRHLEDNGLTGEGAAFATELVQGVVTHRDDLDKIIARAAPNWPMDQMAKVDKNVLRLAIYELLYNNEVPLKAAINEAVELGKRFGSDSSSRFVNGVLGTVAAQVPPRRRGAGRTGGGAPASMVETPVSPLEALDFENLEGLTDTPP